MSREASQHAVELVVIFTVVLDAAATLVNQWEDSVDLGILGKQGVIEPPCDVLADRGRAIHGRDDGYVISGAHATVGATVSLECIAFQWCRIWRNLSRRGVFSCELTCSEVVHVNACARLNVGGGEADGLSIFVDPLALGYASSGNLVPQPDGFGQGDAYIALSKAVANWESPTVSVDDIFKSWNRIILLEVIIDSKLSGTSHVKYKIGKAKRHLMAYHYAITKRYGPQPLLMRRAYTNKRKIREQRGRRGQRQIQSL